MKMLRYGSGLVSMTVCCSIFLVLGLLMTIGFAVLGVAGGPGDVFLIIVVMFPTQVIYTLSISNLVQSSPAKKRMQTSVPATVDCFNMMILYLVNALCKGIVMTRHPELVGTICVEMVTLAGFAAFIMLYMGVGYKYFWTGIVPCIIVYYFTYSRLDAVNKIRFGIFGNSAGSFALALVIGLVIIVLGGFGQYGLSLLVYKAPMSKYAQSATVRKEM